MAGEGRARSVVIVELGEGAKRWQAKGLEEDDETEGVFVLAVSFLFSLASISPTRWLTSTREPRWPTSWQSTCGCIDS